MHQTYGNGNQNNGKIKNNYLKNNAIPVKHTIEISGIKIYAFHGCLAEEERIGGNYVVDVMLNTDFSDAAISDQLEHTIDYVDVNRIVAQEMAIRSKLIEHVGQRIVNRLRDEIKNIDYLMVRITKITPPINGNVDKVAIKIEEHF
jgi:dihydroneopterin aldolase